MWMWRHLRQLRRRIPDDATEIAVAAMDYDNGRIDGCAGARKEVGYREIEVAGPALAQSLTELGLIDEYRIYLHPVVLGHGKPYFAGPRPPLRLMTSDRIDEDVIRLTYVAA
jgi:riboflavin biosynthesis pyrimidine reductase